MAFAGDLRADPRTPVMLLAELDDARRRKWVRVRDISNGGIRLATRERMEPGQVIELRLAGGGWQSARVVWARGTIVGLRFCRAIEVEAMMKEDSSASA